jgi:dephospho-CoA kinase
MLYKDYFPLAVAYSHDGKYIVVLGAPGSGKSINIKWISEAYGIPWINLREVVYAEVRQEAQKQNRGVAASTASHKRGGYAQKRNENTKKALEKLIAGELVSDDSLNAFRSIAAAVVYYYGESLQTIDANMEPSAVTAAIATALEK